MNRSKDTSTAKDGKEINPHCNDAEGPIEIELDNKALRAMERTGQSERSLDDDAPEGRDLIDTATNLELSQSLDDLRSLSWPGLEPKPLKKPDK